MNYLRLSFLSLLLANCVTSYDQELILKLENTTNSCNRNIYYIDSACDSEIEFFQDVEKEFSNIDLKEINQNFLENISNEKGINFATSLLYLKLVKDTINSNFLEELYRIEKKNYPFPDFSNKNIVMLIVPGMFYKDNPNTGAKGGMISNIAKELGIKSQIIPIDQTGTTVQNAETICSYLSDLTIAKEIWITSISKGGLDFLTAYKICGRKSFFDKVKAWWNIGGMLHGSPVVTLVQKDFIEYWKARYYFYQNGYDWNGLMDLEPKKHQQDLMTILEGSKMVIIHIMGIPLSFHTSFRAEPYYQKLSIWGPNDGMNLLVHSYRIGDYILPLFRQDHYFLFPFPKEKLSALFVFTETKTRKLQYSKTGISACCN